MKKRIGSLLLSLALCLTLLPTTALATGASHANHCVCGATHSVVGNHESDNTPANGWTGVSDLSSITTGGHYYLTDDVTITTKWEPAHNTVLCLNGHSIKRSTSGAVIEVPEYSTFTLTDCATTSGTITHSTDVTGRGVTVKSNSTFNMYGGSITNNTATSGIYGAGVYLKGTFNLYGGSITNNTVPSHLANGYQRGAGVYVASDGAFTMEGGKISNNTAKYGGGVYVAENSRFLMKNGIITGNTATYGTVYDNGTFTMSGGQISGNSATGNCGGVFVYQGSFTVSGTAKVTDNTKDSAADNVYLKEDKTITVGTAGLSSGASIGVTTETTPTDGTPVTIATGANNGDTAYFSSDVTDYLLVQDGTTIKLSTGSTTPSPETGHTVTVTAGAHMTRKSDSGADTQADLTGAMTDVVYTADEGYYFPVDYAVASSNGICVTRNTADQITVSGTPTDDVTITLADASVKPTVTIVYANDETTAVTAPKVGDVLKAKVENAPANADLKYYWSYDDGATSPVIEGSTTADTYTVSDTCAGKKIGVYVYNGARSTENPAPICDYWYTTAVVAGSSTPSTGTSVTVTTADELTKAMKKDSGYTTVTLGENITLETTVFVEKHIVLDLNGFSITADSDWKCEGCAEPYDEKKSDGSPLDKTDAMFVVVCGSKLTVNDSSADKTGTITVGGVYKDTLILAIKMTVNSKNDTSKTAELVVNGGTIIGNYYGIFGNGSRPNTKITINGGTIKGTAENDSTSIYHPQGGTLIINGGTLEGATGLYVKSGTVTITGGTIKAVGKQEEYRHEKSGFKNTGDALVVEACDYPSGTPVIVNISDGNFESANGLSVGYYQQDTGHALANEKFVTGGTFSSDPSAYAANDYIGTKNSDGTYGVVTKSGLTSGTYTSDPTGSLASGYYAVDNGDGTWSVRAYSSGGSSTSTYAVTASAAKNGTVTVSPKNASKGTTVTITVTPDEGYTLDTLTVTDKNGDALELTAKSGKYTFKMPAGKVTVTATFTKDDEELPAFADVTADKYYYDAVLWAAENSITGGVDETYFMPHNACTRAQIVTFLWRAAGSPEPNAMSSFTDVSANAYYAKAVAWAVENGITNGFADGTFGVNTPCTRAQAVAFLFRYAAANGMEAVTLQELVSGYTDAASVPGYALSAFNWALAQGIVNGNDGNLMPNNDCTRAQIVTMLYRLLGA